MTDNDSNNTTSTVQRPSHHRREKERDRFFVVRNILNLIFVVGAVVGMLLYFFHDETVGTIVIFSAMAFKIVECVFRIIK